MNFIESSFKTRNYDIGLNIAVKIFVQVVKEGRASKLQQNGARLTCNELHFSYRAVYLRKPDLAPRRNDGGEIILKKKIELPRLFGYRKNRTNMFLLFLKTCHACGSY